MKIRLLFFLQLAVMANLVHSQIIRADGRRFNPKEIDRTVQRLMDAAGVSGLSIGIIAGDQPAYVKSYGYKNKTGKQLINENTSLYAASLAKSLFAYLVMQLADEKVIDLDKPLYQYLAKPLPEYADYKDLAGDDRWKLITARHCLSHTTGFPNWRFLNPKGSEKLEIFFTPGTRYAYSGEGIVLLQLVIETITGQKLEELAQKNIFIPFGMTRTSFVWQAAFNNDYANGHSFDEDTFAVRKRSNANAAGSMQTTITDYTQFIAAVLHGKALSASSRKEMLSPQTGIFTKRQFPSLNNDTTDQNKNIQLSYGLGWGLFKSNDGWAFFKEGHSDDGWEHYAIAVPDKKIALILMGNSMNAESIYKELVEVLTGITIPWEWEGYIPYKPTVQVPLKTLSQYTGNYEGKVKARVFLENGQLKIEAPSEGLPKTTLYASSVHSFFMKSVPITIEFLRNPGGAVEKISVNDEGEIYELGKEEEAPEAAGVVKPPKDVLTGYTGKYVMKGHPDRTLTVELKNNSLLLKMPGQEVLWLEFYSNADFRVKSVIHITGGFISENGKVTTLVIEQGGRFEWVKQ